MKIGQNQHFVMAGEIILSNEDLVLRTTLGSCIAVIAHHPQSRLGAMCHYLLPEVISDKNKKPDNFYGTYALSNMQQQLSIRFSLSEFTFWLAGGGSMFSNNQSPTDLSTHFAQRNIRLARQWSQKNRILFKEESTGENVCRTVSLNIWSGQYQVKTYPH